MRLCVRMLGIASRGTATEPPPKLRARVWLPDSSHVPTFIGGPKSELSPKLLEVFHVAQLVHDTIVFAAVATLSSKAMSWARGWSLIQGFLRLNSRHFDPTMHASYSYG
jgi:hypothetical protein